MVAPVVLPAPEVGFWKSRVGLSPTGTVSLAAVLAVLVFVSLARLRPLMTHENEVDARQTVELLAAQLSAWSAERGHQRLTPDLEELAEGGPVIQALADGAFEEDGQVLKRHGYLFSVVELPPPPPLDPGTVLAAPPTRTTPEPLLGVLAWPWKHGNSGRRALLCTADQRLYRHPNTPPRGGGPAGPDPRGGVWGWR
jgi:hypothetical protein